MMAMTKKKPMKKAKPTSKMLGKGMAKKAADKMKKRNEYLKNL